MKNGFEIVQVDQGKGGALYSVLFGGEKESELDKFLQSEQLHLEKGFNEIVQRLSSMTNSLGFESSFLK